MTIIIAGRFERQDQAERASAELARSGFPTDRVASFFINPAGQHNQFPIGGDEDESPGMHHAGPNAATAAATGAGIGLVAGLATIPVLGPAAPLAGAGVGAYVGSLVGALNKAEHTKFTDEQAVVPANDSRSADVQARKSGLLVAVSTPLSEDQDNAVRVLQQCGASDIERAQGTIRDGEWQDFDPLAPFDPVSNSHREQPRSGLH